MHFFAVRQKFDLFCWCAQALFPKCLPTRQTGTYSFPNNRSFVTCLRLLVSCTTWKSKRDGMQESFHFLFQPHGQGSSFKIMLPTRNQLKTLIECLFFQSLLKLFVSCQLSMAFIFSIATTVSFLGGWKTPWTPMPMATMELKHSVVSKQKPSTECPAIFLSPPWPHIWWWICTPRRRASCSNQQMFFLHMPHFHKMLFHKQI